MKHTFAICAYGDSPYLETCIRSLKRQSEKTEIILCTSTPSQYVKETAKRYQIPVYVREGKNGIQEDWNFAYEMAEGDYVTLAHQDDMYHKDYVKFLLQRAEQYPDMTVFTTDYATVKGNRLQSRKGLVEWVKVILRLPLTNPEWTDREWVKKAALIFGNPICCPSCAYHKKLLGEGPLFTSRFHYVLDWDTMWKLAGEKGRFVCEERPLIYYRVHDGATTKQWIDAGGRTEEEMAMFRKLWPEPAARLIEYFYRKAYKAYD